MATASARKIRPSTTPRPRRLRPATVLLPATAFAVARLLRQRARRQSGQQAMPRTFWPDSTLPMLFKGYNYIGERCRRYGSELFQTRLLLHKSICMVGEEPARLFYDPFLFQRQGAAPRRLKKTLFGQPGVQGLDDEAHRHRKAAFMALMTPASVGRLAELTASEWRQALERWQHLEEVVLFNEASRLLLRAVCRWSDVPLAEAEVGRRAADMEAMIDAPAALGPRHWRGRMARRRSERWIMQLIEEVRSGERQADPGGALHLFAWHRDLAGELLDPRVAAVEVLNILRPTVAISRYIVFTAHALYQHPEWRRRLQDGEKELLLHFVQEVRRFYPFFPVTAARVRRDFDWQGYHFPAGTRVVLDLYGTNHDPRRWEAPEAFRPERFRSWQENPFDFIPQGGGDTYAGHRCAGEWLTIELMQVALRFLVTEMHYAVPEQDLRIHLWRIPAIPQSRFILREVQATGPVRRQPEEPPRRFAAASAKGGGPAVDYSNFVNAAANLSFIGPDAAEAAVKAVIGILASRLEEAEARQLIANLPDPLYLENLRGHQRRPPEISLDQYYGSLARQFQIAEDEAQVLAVTILRLVKEVLDVEGMRQIERSLPEDWSELVERV